MFCGNYERWNQMLHHRYLVILVHLKMSQPHLINGLAAKATVLSQLSSRHIQGYPDISERKFLI